MIQLTQLEEQMFQQALDELQDENVEIAVWAKKSFGDRTFRLAFTKVVAHLTGQGSVNLFDKQRENSEEVDRELLYRVLRAAFNLYLKRK